MSLLVVCRGLGLVVTICAFDTKAHTPSVIANNDSRLIVLIMVLCNECIIFSQFDLAVRSRADHIICKYNNNIYFPQYPARFSSLFLMGGGWRDGKKRRNLGGTRRCVCRRRRERDSNPRRCDPQRFSRPPQSTTLPSLLWYACTLWFCGCKVTHFFWIDKFCAYYFFYFYFLWAFMSVYELQTGLFGLWLPWIALWW